LNKQQQFAPIVGQAVSGGRIGERSAYAAIIDTIAVGRILYDRNYPIVPNNEC
jgi:hypothetical protein